MLRFGCFALIVIALLRAEPAPAQTVVPRYFDANVYAQLGLDQAWTTQVQMDAGRARVAGVRLQVVGMDSYESLQRSTQQVYEVTFGDQVRRFGENDLDVTGLPIGRQEAERLAEKLAIQLSARGIEAKASVRQVPLVVMYVQSSRGALQAMNAETGETLWNVAVGEDRHPALSPAANDRFVAAISGSKLHLLKRESGETVWQRDLDENPIFGPSISPSYVFVPGNGGHVSGYKLPDDQSDYRNEPAWGYHSGARITAPAFLTEKTLSWSTNLGQMFVVDLAGPTVLYRHQTGAPIYGGAAYVKPDQLIVASTDGYVTSIHETDGTIRWSVSTGADIESEPLVSGNLVYVVTRLHDLYCLGAEQGAEHWIATGIDRLISVGHDRVFARDLQGRLVAIDAASGSLLAGMPLGAFDQPLLNAVTDRVYLMSRDGSILCLRESSANYPIIARPLPISPEEAAAAAKAKQPAEEQPAADDATTPPAEDDAFGTDLDADAMPADSADQPADESQPEDAKAADDAKTDAPAGDDAFPF